MKTEGAEIKLSKNMQDFRYQVLTAVAMKCSGCRDKRCAVCRKRTDVSEEQPPSSGPKNKLSKEPAPKQVAAGVLLDMHFCPEDGGNMFLRNVRSISTDYEGSYGRSLSSYARTPVTTAHVTYCTRSRCNYPLFSKKHNSWQ
jgi:hypothetical protein